MRARTAAGLLVLAALVPGCGIEQFAHNFLHEPWDRPAAKITGKVLHPGAVLAVTDGAGTKLEPFLATQDKEGNYEFRLPSSKYSMIYVTARAGNMQYRTIVPFIDEESAVEGVDLGAEGTAEALIVEARLNHDGKLMKQITPSTYVGTQKLIRAAFKTDGHPAKRLRDMVERYLTLGGDPMSGSDPAFFEKPEYHPVTDSQTDEWKLKTRPVSPAWQGRNLFDSDGDGNGEEQPLKIEQALREAAALFRPAGCPDPAKIRVVFAVDFNAGRLNGNCGSIDRFKWTTDKPGKSMFFVGWVHKESPVQDPLLQAMVGGGTPNQLNMYDDGTNGDETSGDNVWTIFFDVPRNARIGYKYTWGFRGAVWTGTEEWPGNSRIIEAVDVNGDDLVYRLDNYGDEATNKDASNLNLKGNGTVDWTTVLRGDVPECREQPYDADNDCDSDGWFKPTAVGPLTVACSE